MGVNALKTHNGVKNLKAENKQNAPTGAENENFSKDDKLTEEQKIDMAAERILEKHIKAFEELAK